MARPPLAPESDIPESLITPRASRAPRHALPLDALAMAPATGLVSDTLPAALGGEILMQITVPPGFRVETTACTHLGNTLVTTRITPGD